MTDDREADIMRDVLERLAVARKNRASLIAQARKYRELMEKWTSRLDEKIGDSDKASSVDNMAAVNGSWPSQDDMDSVMREIHECDQAISSGYETLRKWNVID